jgi:uracil-DNA glycosylase
MSLDDLLHDIRACRACAAEFAHAPRPVVMAAPEARILICGQAPGARVHASGRPFDDASGDRLRSWMGVDREAFYGDPRIGVAAMAFCYPGTDPLGGDRPPPARCAEFWRRPLLALLPKVELTLLIGAHAQRWALKSPSLRMTETVLAWRRHLPSALVLPHPSWRNTAWLARHPWFEAEVVPYLRIRVAEALAR